MTRSQYWQLLMDKNPQLATCSVRFSRDQLRTFVGDVWDTAYGEGTSDALVAQVFGGAWNKGKDNRGQG